MSLSTSNYNTAMSNINSNSQTTPVSVQEMEMNDKIFVWNACKATFRPSTTDLLSDFVDPAEECHMELKPDDFKTKQLKQHKRQNSDVTAATEEIQDFSFLEECFDVPLNMMMAGCPGEDDDDVNMHFVF